jgi:hypothetical protein
VLAFVVLAVVLGENGTGKITIATIPAMAASETGNR